MVNGRKIFKSLTNRLFRWNVRKISNFRSSLSSSNRGSTSFSTGIWGRTL